MAEYDNTNRFTLFKNERKESDKHADYTGTLNVDGTEYFLNAWLKEGSKGKFFSGNIKRKEQRSVAPSRHQSVRNDPDSEIPF
jgi:hypothetical protein